MSRTSALVAAVAILTVVAGTGAYLLTARTLSSSRDGGAGGALAPTRARAGKLDDVYEALDLVRPAGSKRAEDFAVAMADGSQFRLSEHRGKVVFVNFWATWCPPCREEMPAMEKLWQRYRARGFEILAISVDKDTAAVAPFVTEKGLTFPVALDAAMAVSDAYGVRALPSSFIVDRQGDFVALAIGARKWDTEAARSLIEALTR